MAWARLHRKLTDSDLWLAEPFTRGQAWADLFARAAYKPGFVRIRGVRIDYGRGQLVASYRYLAKRWQWSLGKVIRFLNELENDAQIETLNSALSTVITIVNYDRYQSRGNADDDTDAHTDGTQTGTQTEQSRKKEQEGKRKNKNLSRRQFEPGDEELARWMFERLRSLQPNRREPDFEAWANEVRIIRERDRRSLDEIRSLFEWANRDGFWRQNILSPSKLREKWDDLELRRSTKNRPVNAISNTGRGGSDGSRNL